MPAPRKYPPELIERGVQMVVEQKRAEPGRSGIVRAVGELLGIHPEVLRHWVNKADFIGSYGHHVFGRSRPHGWAVRDADVPDRAQ
ncbi:hypothetical protein ACGF0D_29530, partial [Kitasatospora sp. NPDC048298]